MIGGANHPWQPGKTGNEFRDSSLWEAGGSD